MDVLQSVKRGFQHQEAVENFYFQQLHGKNKINLEILEGVKRRFQHHEAAVEKYRRRHVRNSCHRESEIESDSARARAREFKNYRAATCSRSLCN
jgi:predicted ATP-dependent endonuclease of OLD family